MVDVKIDLCVGEDCWVCKMRREDNNDAEV